MPPGSCFTSTESEGQKASTSPRPSSLLSPGPPQPLPPAEKLRAARPTRHTAEAANIYFLWQLRETLGLEPGIPRALFLNYILELKGSLCIIQKRTVLPLMALKHAKSEQNVPFLQRNDDGLLRGQWTFRSPAGAEQDLQAGPRGRTTDYLKCSL